MKKIFLTVFIMTVFTLNANAFEIGLIGGCSYGDSVINGPASSEEYQCTDMGLGFNGNGAIVFGSNYGSSNFGAFAEIGWMGCTGKLSYNWKYDIEIGEVITIFPFFGLSYAVPIGFGLNAGVAFKYAFGPGNLYADIRYEPNSSFYAFNGGSINIGYIFRIDSPEK